MNEIADQLITISDRAYLLSELDNIVQSFYRTSGSKDLNVLGIRSTSLPFWQTVLKDISDSHQVEAMRQEIQSFRVIRVSLPFDPERIFIEKMIATFRATLGPRCLLDIQVNQSLAAGLIYSVEGKILDRSLRVKLSEVDLRGIVSGLLPILSS